jgi:phenol 2-monooxygenase
LQSIAKILSRFPEGVIELVVLHPLTSNTFVWADVPEVVKGQAEMRFYNGTELENAYKVYGVDPKQGAVTVIRPDGYIGVIAELKDTDRVYAYLKGCLREVTVGVNGAY